MRGEERGIIGFPEKLFGFGAIGIGADRDRVDIGALIGAIIVHPPSTRPTIGCLQWSGLFGIGLKPVQLFGIGSGGYSRESPAPGGLNLLLRGAANKPVQLFVLFEAPRISVFVPKKNKKRCFLLLTRVAMTATYNESTEKEAAMAEDKLVYVTVKVWVTPDSDEQDVINEAHYEFRHSEIRGSEIIEVETPEWWKYHRKF